MNISNLVTGSVPKTIQKPNCNESHSRSKQKDKRKNAPVCR